MSRVGPKLRAGLSYRRLLMTLPLLVALPIVAGALLPRLGGFDPEDAPMTCGVQRKEFLHEIHVRGVVESANNVEVRCEVGSRSSSRATIVEIVDEGTYVEAGDFLVRFESARLEDLRTTQLLHGNEHAARLVTARGRYETAVITQNEYLNGTYPQQKQKIEKRVAAAEEEYRQAKLSYQFAKTKFYKGYTTELQLEAGQFAQERAFKALSQVRNELDVLEKYTRVRMLKELESDIITRKARVDEEQRRCDLEEEDLREIEEAIAHCVVTAPSAGQVVYAHVHHNGHSHLIEEGATLYNTQVVVRLPDPKQMQVEAKIPEAKIALVKAGTPVTVTFNGLPGVELDGEIERVNEFAEPKDYHGANRREYESIIKINTPSAELRPGLTADVNIRIEWLDDQLQLPLQAVFQHAEKDYCLTLDSGVWKAHEITLGSDNGKFVVIREGLEEGRRVVLETSAYRKKANLPGLAVSEALVSTGH